MYARVATFAGDPSRVDDAIEMVRAQVESGETPAGLEGAKMLMYRALAALELVPARLDSRLILPSATGGYIDLHNFRARDWLPAVLAAGFVDAEGKATKRIYDLRHTFATFAIHALVPSFIIARVMGTSEAMLRKHYGHLLPDTDDLVRERLNAWDAENEAFGHGTGTEGE